ncbi:transcription regulator protein BACH1-like isoform X2 [Myxocyprinus asiaticus]|nr:transcription regulator protein BACH1-like isoform X2 [Myxocyprinus asiaticus]XP_051521050.1 transcription regulator protein BACH1-like isoform X2 [Myxocyprinus asiaticus]
MSVDGPRTSVFTFQSAVHSHHVLCSLEELRQNQILCDVTVEVESRSFRAHASVLASCCDYFYTRLTNQSRPNHTVSLPDEVTVEGFEPLLQFAYTAKLHFTKENILEIHRCAEFLGFHNLDKACFEFLVPKLADSSKTPQKVKSKGNSQGSCEKSQPACGNHSPINDHNPENGKDDATHLAESVAQTSCATPSTECPKDCPSISNDKRIQLDIPTQCAKNTSYHVGVGQEQFCLENCGPHLPSSSVAANEVCPFLSLSSTSGNEKLHSARVGCGRDILTMDEEFQKELTADVHCVSTETSSDKDLNMNITQGHFDQYESSLILPNDCHHPCSLSSTESSMVLDSIDSAGNLNNIGANNNQVFDPSEQTFPDLAPKDVSTERSTVEREVAEHLTKGFWPDLSSTLTEPLPLDSVDQTSAGNSSDFHWLKHLDLGAASDDCPFLRDLSSNERQISRGDNLSKEDMSDSPCMSPINSMENSECESDGDSEQCGSNEQVQEVDLPFPVEQISSISRRAFLQMLKEQRLTPEQLEFVQDVRRRCKNRVAAQRCRKRKLDCIYRLEGDIKRLRSEKEKLLQDRNQLKLSMEEMHQNLSGLCQSLPKDTSPQSEQLQVLARYVSSDCPTSVLLSPIASPNLAGPDRETHADTGLEVFIAEEVLDTCPQEDNEALRSSTALQDNMQSTVTDPDPCFSMK